MSYDWKQEGDKYIVYNSDTGETKGTHDTKQEAFDQLAALHIHVPDAKKTAEAIKKASTVPLEWPEQDVEDES